MTFSIMALHIMTINLMEVNITTLSTIALMTIVVMQDRITTFSKTKKRDTHPNVMFLNKAGAYPSKASLL
jgi:hypothetical protein